jgi:hypothetical protein
MLSASQRHLALLACFLVAPVLGLATTIDVNGGTIGTGGSVSDNFSFTVDGGLFDVTGYYTAYESGSGPDTGIVVNATAVYEGSTPLTSAYSFTVDDIQYYTLATLPTGGGYDEIADLAGTAAGSSLVADLIIGPGTGNDTLPALTFTSSGSASTSSTGSFSGLSSPLEEQGELTFNFAAGTAKGASIGSVPEPGGVIPVVAILILGLGVPAIRRSRLLSKNMG